MQDKHLKKNPPQILYAIMEYKLLSQKVNYK